MMKKLVTILSIFLIISFSSICGAVSPGEGGGAGGTSLDSNRNILIYLNQPTVTQIGSMILFGPDRFLLISTEQLSQVDMVALPDGSLVDSEIIRELINQQLVNNPNLVLIILPLDLKHLK